MALTKEIKIGKITIDRDRVFHVENDVIIKENGKEISKGKSFETITPIDNVSTKNDKIKKISKAVHTKKVKDKYKAKKDKP